MEALYSRTLIGRLEYVQMGKKDWISWASKHWKPLFSYVPTISLLAKGWLVIVFSEEAHASFVLNSLWCIREGSLVLDHWHVHFDPLRERIKKRHLWVLLPGLPFPLWSCALLEGVGNTPGHFVTIEEDFMRAYDKRMAKILMEMDISMGLPAKVEILCQERLFLQ